MTSEEQLEDRQAEVSYLPVIVRIPQGMPKRRWEALPGVAMMPTPKSLKKVFDNPAVAKHTFGSGNYVIRIDTRPYLLHAKKRLRQFTDGQPSDFYPQNIAKNLVLSVSLEYPTAGFIVGGHFGGREENGDFIQAGWSNIPAGRKAGHEELSGFRVSYQAKSKLDKKSVISNFRRLEQYFLSPMTGNTVHIKCDRIAVAAQGIWAALGTPYDDQAFITFAMVLEALLTTAPAEVTLQIAERAAVLIGKSPADRRELYRSVKRLYGTRSKLVHGAGMLTRKAKDRVNIHPTFNSVSPNALREIGAIAIRVLRAVLHNDELYDVAQRKDQTKLDAYYVTRLLS